MKICPGCGRDSNDLALRPSGKSFLKHPGPDGEMCPGGTPVDPPEPTPVSNTKACVECGEQHPVLKSGKVRKHTHPRLNKVCLQQEGVEVECPQGKHRIRLTKAGLLPTHKDPELGARCIGSNKTLEDAKVAKVDRKPTGKVTPPRPRNPYRDLTPQEKSKFKASRLAEQLKEMGWRSRIELKGTVAELTLRRGRNAEQEEMFITWDGGACVGGDGMITHNYRGRTIAVRNANAVRLRAALSPEQIAAEHAKVANRKVGRPNKGAKKALATVPSLPFDPGTATDEEIMKALAGKKVTWFSSMKQKDESENVRDAKVEITKAGSRNVVLHTGTGTRIVKVDALKAVA